MNRDTLRIGIIGCGAVSEKGHLPALNKLGMNPVLFVDKNLDRAKSLAAHFPLATVADDHSACIGNVDAVIVAVPHGLHADVCEPLLRQGIHVLVEKPMAVTVADCDRMIEAAQASGAVLAVGLMRRFRRSFKFAAELLKAGKLGEIRSFTLHEGGVFSWPVASASFFDRRMAGGGVLIDTGAHSLDLLHWWFAGSRILEYRDDVRDGVEADCTILVELPGGGRGAVELSRIRRMSNVARIEGTKGTLEIVTYTNEIRVLQSDDQELIAAAAEVSGRPQTYEDLFVDQLLDWQNAIDQKVQPTVTGQEARESIKTIEYCYSHRKPAQIPGEGWTNMKPVSGLRGKTVLVTGASGFIGGRLVERLVETEGCQVRALVRNWTHASRLCRHRAELFSGDLSDQNRIIEMLRGVDVVFHSAFDFKDMTGNIDQTRNLAEACLKAGVSRLVHLSTISVHEPLGDGPVNEQSPEPETDIPYTVTKRKIERLLLEMHRERALPVVMIQPTIVYGPFSKAWTVGPIERIKANLRFVLPTEGVCNPVYIDDVIQALVRAATSERVLGRRYLVSGPDQVSWKEFFENYAKMVGVDNLTFMDPKTMATLVSAPPDDFRRQMTVDRKEALSCMLPLWLKNTIKTVMGQRLWKSLGDTIPPPVRLPRFEEFLLFRAKAVVRIDEARQGLGYEPEYSYERGMNVTRDYVKWANL